MNTIRFFSAPVAHVGLKNISVLNLRNLLGFLDSAVRYMVVCGLLVFASGCATPDCDQPRAASYALQDTDDTSLGSRVSSQVAARNGRSGFALINYAVNALAAADREGT